MIELPASPLYLLGSICIGIIVPSICGFFAMFYKFPEHLVRLGLRYQYYKCGMKIKYIKEGDARFCYGEKNVPRPDRPTLVFVHGFTSSKVQWLAAFAGLRGNNHMIAMDLPGHGDSYIPHETEKIDLDAMDSKLSMFLDLVGLEDKKIHIVGASLGGALAGIYSAHHPERIAKVTMVCPAMNPPVESDFVASLKKAMTKDLSEITYEDCELLPQDVTSMKAMFDKCIYNKMHVNMHNQIYQGLLNIRLQKNRYFLELYKATNTEEHLNLLTTLAPSIKMPSQIIWGKHDEIIHSSGAKYLQKRLPDCRYMDVFEECGHAIDIDRPGSFCKVLHKFIMDV